ncbi:GGDEF domain-containing protein [Treponema sp.]|uniref:transporter substrate-binding domain-containing diguanylate cyclase n=1 Tax=Treponema sp. TaxID=166 RepID=UPI00298DE73D|nr:GGDEF domain-containing protein [Treponema sp.]MCQ2240233.1 GGDEF domain-containing protein [Treponema sp.]
MRKAFAFFRLIFVSLSVLCMATSVFGKDHIHTVVRKNIKVGYYENEAFQEGASDGAVKSGYAYEYLQKVSSMTGWQYEYVYGSWAEVYSAFLRGEVDLLAGLGYSESRLSYMNYPDYPMGYESYYLFVRSKETTITRDAETLRGKRIGTIPGLLQDAIVSWLAERNVKSEIVVFNDVYERDIALERGDIDAFIGEGSSVSVSGFNKPLLKIASVNMYLCVSKNRPDILKELNMALSELDSNDPFYVNQLSEKYFSNSAVTVRVSPAEHDWLDNHNNTLRVGYMDNFLPYCGTDSKGNVTGILVDAMDAGFKKIKANQEIKITYQPFQNTEDMITAIHNHDIDVIFPVSNNVYYMEQNDLFQSKQVITSAMNLVYLDKIDENTTETIAINRHNQIQYDYAQTNLPDSRMILYDSVSECLDAVNSGDAGCAILSGLRASVLLRNSKYINLKYIELPASTTKCFGVSTHNLGVLSLLDRALNTLDSKDTLTFTYKYLENESVYSIREFIKRHQILVFIICAIFFAIALITVEIFISKNQKEKLYFKFAYKDSLTGAFNRRAYEEDVMAFENSRNQKYVCVSMDLNGLKKVNDDLGHLAGDELIKDAYTLIEEAFGKYGKIYRTGGDEYSALLRTDKETFGNAKLKLDELCKAWKGTYSDTLCISVGAAFSAEAETDVLMDLWKLADKRMYDAKSEHYRKSGMDRRGQNDAHKALCSMYTKILKINLTEDSYQIINMDMDEQTVEKGFADRISTWLSDFGTSGQVHPEDLNGYKKKTDIKYMQDYFRSGKKNLTIFYRRKYGDEYKRAMMQIIPAPDYEPESQSLFLYVNNVHSIEDN